VKGVDVSIGSPLGEFGGTSNGSFGI